MPLTERDKVALVFAANLAGAREAYQPDVPAAQLHYELMRDAFAYADSFIDYAQSQPSPQTGKG